MIKIIHTTKGTYNVYRYMYNDIKINENKIIESSDNYFKLKQLVEAKRKTFSKKDKELGGTIVFSTDINATRLSSNALVNWVKQKIATLDNRLNKDKKINKAVDRTEGVSGWTIGRFLDGRYKSDSGEIFDEKSLSVDLVGVNSEVLENFARELCREFGQESVLVKDRNTEEIYFEDQE